MAPGINDYRSKFLRVLYRVGQGRYTAPMTEDAFRHDSSALTAPSVTAPSVAGFPSLFRLVQRFALSLELGLALALASAMVLASPASASVSPVGPALLGSSSATPRMSVAFPARVNSALESAPSLQASSSCPGVDLKAVEFDVDDPESLSDAPALVALVAVLHSVPHLREHAFRFERLVDTSRFAISVGLPRGPPVLS